MGRVSRVVDTIVVVLCIPFYVVVTPLILLHEWWQQRRSVRLGLEITHWPAHDLREDDLVADVSRVSEGLVGIRRRTFDVREVTELPSYSAEIEYIPVQKFWVPTPFRIRGEPTEGP